MRENYTRKLAPRARELRNGQTPAERKLWFEFLRTYPVKFRRQVPLLGYVLDFYAPSLRLCIELDGRSHDSAEAQVYDAQRSRVLAEAGVQVLRLANAEVEGNFAGVCAGIAGACGGDYRSTPS
ncbi:endonuclease domain-containing protein [Deinococcus marmoris]|uniref:DUF559 domain-containing protein n=1 Tax=Deinococcus marmoris TaxID=249408 RepID=A0A1U7P3K4_9DEIO|nr:endonuclease domain-containing protein [Deinococcus marmoris]OLV19753.1 hypothetical protein BOO71_0001624 [Deinococcus marmoris]